MNMSLDKLNTAGNMNIRETSLESLESFSDPFFDQFPLSQGKHQITLPNGDIKHYLFPTYFSDVTMSAGIFSCNLQKVRQRISDSRLKPVPTFPGRSMVVIVNYHYGKIHQMQPYNETLIMVPVVLDRLVTPLIPALFSNYPGAGYYMLALPMNSTENQIRGETIWGLPKTLHKIEHQRKNHDRVTKIYSSPDEIDIEMTLPMIGRSKQRQQTGKVYSYLNGDLIKFHSVFSGEIRSQMHLFNQNHKGLRLGKGPISDLLRRLDVNPKPFMTRSCEGLKSCLFLPD